MRDYTAKEMQTIANLSEEESLIGRALLHSIGMEAKVEITFTNGKDRFGMEAIASTILNKMVRETLFQRMIDCSKKRQALYTQVALDISEKPTTDEA